MIWSPSISSPFSSTARHRSASPSNARPRSYPPSTTAFASFPRCVEPQPLLMFTPSGSALKYVASSGKRENSFRAVALAAPLAQSKTTLMGLRPSTVEARWSRYASISPAPSEILPISPCVFVGSSPSCKMSDSMFASSSSLSLKPREENILIPLCSKGLCDAEITMPASACSRTVKYATAGVGITPSFTASQPLAVRPARSAASSISEEMRVSLPMTTFGRFPSKLPKLMAAA